MEKVARHPFAEFVEDSWGESKAKTFGGDEDVWVEAVDESPRDPANSPTSSDSTVVARAQLLAEGEPPANWSAHDEWTVRGRRWLQVGETITWRDPWDPFVGWQVNLERRTG